VLSRCHSSSFADWDITAANECLWVFLFYLFYPSTILSSTRPKLQTQTQCRTCNN
jgi:hypothetical protein